MALESNDSQINNSSIKEVSEKEMQSLWAGYNVDLAVVVFEEKDIKRDRNGQNESSARGSESSSSGSGGLQKTETEFGDGKVNTLETMLNAGVVEIPIKSRDEKKKASEDKTIEEKE